MFELSKYVKQLGNFNSLEDIETFLQQQQQKSSNSSNLNQQIEDNITDFQQLQSSRKQIQELIPSFDQLPISTIEMQLQQQFQSISSDFQQLELNEQENSLNEKESDVSKELSSILDCQIDVAISLLVKYHDVNLQSVEIPLKLAQSKFYAQYGIIVPGLQKQIFKNNSPQDFLPTLNLNLSSNLNNFLNLIFEEDSFAKQTKYLIATKLNAQHIYIVSRLPFIEIYIGELIKIQLFLNQFVQKYIRMLQVIFQQKFTSLPQLVIFSNTYYENENLELLDQITFKQIFFNNYQFGQSKTQDIEQLLYSFLQELDLLLSLLQTLIGNSSLLNLNESISDFNQAIDIIFQYLLSFIQPFLANSIVINSFVLQYTIKLNYFFGKNQQQFYNFKNQMEAIQQLIIQKLFKQSEDIIWTSIYMYYNLPAIVPQDKQYSNINMQMLRNLFLLGKIASSGNLSNQLQLFLICIDQLSLLSKSNLNFQTNEIQKQLKQTFIQFFISFVTQIEIIIEKYFLYHSQLRISTDTQQQRIIQNLIEINFAKSFIPKDQQFFNKIKNDLEVLINFVFPITCIIYQHYFNLNLKEQFVDHYMQFQQFQIVDIISHFLTTQQNYFSSLEHIPSQQLSSIMGQNFNKLFLLHQENYDKNQLLHPYKDDEKFIQLENLFKHILQQVNRYNSNVQLQKMVLYIRKFIKRTSQTSELIIQNRRITSFSAVFRELHGNLNQEIERWLGLRDLSIIINSISSFKFDDESDFHSAIVANIPHGPWNESQVILIEIIVGVLSQIYKFDTDIYCLVKRDNGRVEKYDKQQMVDIDVINEVIKQIVQQLKGFQQ